MFRWKFIVLKFCDHQESAEVEETTDVRKKKDFLKIIISVILMWCWKSISLLLLSSFRHSFFQNYFQIRKKHLKQQMIKHSRSLTKTTTISCQPREKYIIKQFKVKHLRINFTFSKVMNQCSLLFLTWLNLIFWIIKHFTAKENNILRNLFMTLKWDLKRKKY